MHVRIVGRNLPGRAFCDPEGDIDNVHVALQVGRETVGLVAGDAGVAEWITELTPTTLGDGSTDFRGPAVQGRRGERFFYLTWGNVESDGGFRMFRRAKLMLADIAALEPQDVVAEIDLTDECGHPRCARLRPPAIRWHRADEPVR